MTRVRFWFDPLCPWAWMTSRWLKEVERERDFEIEWRIMSLYMLNEGRDLEDDYKKAMERSLRLTRVVMAAREEVGEHVLGDLYTALGERIHPGGRRDDELITEALDEVGLPASLADETDKYDELLRKAQQEAIDLVGDDVGTPVIAIDDVAFFGPVVTPAPTGEDALKLFDGIVMAASVPGFYELKRSREKGPQF